MNAATYHRAWPPARPDVSFPPAAVHASSPPSAVPDLSDLGEFGLIDRFADLLGLDTAPDLVQGIGDDAAVYRIGPDATGRERVHVVTTDALVEGVHFDRAFAPLERLGFKALSVNVSDVCAMNARPLYATVALGVPPGLATADLDALYRGLARACERYGCTVVGGDVTRARSLLLSITVVGEAYEDDVAYRSGAREGDIVCVTGDLGAAFAGLSLLLDARDRLARDPAFQPALEDFPYTVARQLAPTARLDLVDALARAGVRPTSMIDVSDGLASELHHLCRQSGVGARIAEGALPIDDETLAVAARLGGEAGLYALYGGEDYELLFTVSAEDLPLVPSDGLFTAIGRIVADGVAVHTVEGDEVPLEPMGFDHLGAGRGPA